MNMRMQLLLASILTVSTVTMADKTVKKQDQDITVAAYYFAGFHEDNGPGKLLGEWAKIRDAKPHANLTDHWQPRVPLWGYEEDEADPKAMEKKIDTALEYGVNCFIFDWYWFDGAPNRYRALHDGFLGAKNKDDIDFYLMWANHRKWKEDANGKRTTPIVYDLDTFKDVVARVLPLYLSQPSYLKIDGKPVFAIYDLGVFLEDLGGVKKARKAIDYFDAECKKAGFPGLHLQLIMKQVSDNYSGFDDEPFPAGDQKILDLGAESLTHYQFVHMEGARPYDDYIPWSDAAITKWDIMSKKFDRHGIDYFPQVSIGWDNTPRKREKANVIEKNVNPDAFKTYLVKAKAYLDARPDQVQMITINSWNEWVEGSYLEPDERFQFGYLEAVRDVFGAK